jgi:hypothetical protein
MRSIQSAAGIDTAVSESTSNMRRSTHRA